MEVLDIYDSNFNITGRTIVRGTKIDKENEYIMVFIIFIKNSEDKYLIQKVTPNKGNYYSTTGGHVKSKETYVHALTRETKEEIGIDISKDNYELVSRDIIEFKKAIFNVFYLEKDIDEKDLVLQADEVESVSWMTKDEILELIKNNMFLESHGKMFLKYM